MNHLICKHCPNLTYCYGDEDECERHKQVKNLLEEELPILLREFHRIWGIVEDDFNE